MSRPGGIMAKVLPEEGLENMYFREGFLLTDCSSCCRGQHGKPVSLKLSGPGTRRPLIRRIACPHCHNTEPALRGIAAIHVTSDLCLLHDFSWTCSCFLIILAYVLGAQDTRNVTTRIRTWQPRERAESRSPTSGKAQSHHLFILEESSPESG
jgi:hypothetical protein